jgi:sulfur carrier protein
MAIEIILNGQPRVFDKLEAGATISHLVAALDVKTDRVAIEHNGEIAPRGAWQKWSLNSGDRIELVHFVGGGSFSASNSCELGGGPRDQRSLR